MCRQLNYCHSKTQETEKCTLPRFHFLLVISLHVYSITFPPHLPSHRWTPLPANRRKPPCLLSARLALGYPHRRSSPRALPWTTRVEWEKSDREKVQKEVKCGGENLTRQKVCFKARMKSESEGEVVGEVKARKKLRQRGLLKDKGGNGRMEIYQSQHRLSTTSPSFPVSRSIPEAASWWSCLNS